MNSRIEIQAIKNSNPILKIVTVSRHLRRFNQPASFQYKRLPACRYNEYPPESEQLDNLFEPPPLRNGTPNNSVEMARNAEPLSLKDPRGFTDDRLSREGESDLQGKSARSRTCTTVDGFHPGRELARLGIVSSTADEQTSQATFVNLHGGREIGTWFPRSRNPRGKKQKAPGN